MVQGAEKSISLVQGGRSKEAANLVWEKGTSAPDKRAFTEWLESVKDNPVVIDFKVRWESSMGERAEVVLQQPTHVTLFLFHFSLRC